MVRNLLSMSSRRIIHRIAEWCAWVMAGLLPVKLVYWCAIRLVVHATVGKWRDTVVSDLTCLEALRRWPL